MKLFIGADHQGFELKQALSDHFRTRGYDIVDESNERMDPNDDYPQFAARVVTAMLASNEPDPKGVLICGSGQGMCMAANRFKGIRASLVCDEYEAKASRNDDDSNVLCLSAHELVDLDRAIELTNIWLETPFQGAERFIRRIKELDKLG